jgi:hypothetical protein
MPVAVEGLGQQPFGQGHAHCVGEALAERAGSRFDAGGDAEFGVSGGLRMQLPKALQFVDRQIVAAEVQQA